jgi:hypothetical protein
LLPAWPSGMEADQNFLCVTLDGALSFRHVEATVFLRLRRHVRPSRQRLDFRHDQHPLRLGHAFAPWIRFHRTKPVPAVGDLVARLQTMRFQWVCFG